MSITDAGSNHTAFTYDAFGRVTRTNFPSSLSEYYYNLAGYKYSPHPEPADLAGSAVGIRQRLVRAKSTTHLGIGPTKMIY